MELRRLKYFARVADDGSLTRSAGILRIAQPALSRQMRLLEEELGITLFHRTARGMQLTEDGELFRDAIAGPLRELELAIDHARARSQTTGNLVIGMPPGLTELLALPVADMMRRDFPGLTIRLVEGPTGSLADWLNRGAVDLTLLEEDPRDHRLRTSPVCALPLWLVGNRADPCPLAAATPFARLADLPLVVPSHHLGIKGAIDDAAREQGTVLRVDVYADTPQLVRQLVRSGRGFGLLPEAYCRHELSSGLLVASRVVEPEPVIHVSLASRRRGRVSQSRVESVEQALLHLARDALLLRQAPT